MISILRDLMSFTRTWFNELYPPGIFWASPTRDLLSFTLPEFTEL